MKLLGVSHLGLAELLNCNQFLGHVADEDYSYVSDFQLQALACKANVMFLCKEIGGMKESRTLISHLVNAQNCGKGVVKTVSNLTVNYTSESK